MQNAALIRLKGNLAEFSHTRPLGRVMSSHGQLLKLTGLDDTVRLGDRLRLSRQDGTILMGDVLGLEPGLVTMLPDEAPLEVALGDRVLSLGAVRIAPNKSWIGHVIDPYGAPLDGTLPRVGEKFFEIIGSPPPPMSRKPLGARLDTGFHLFNTILPITRGQRIGIFAGSGVGKSRLLGDLVKSLDADLVVLGLVGERGREINDFTKNVLGEAGMRRSVVIAASSDTAPSTRLRCGLTAMRVAEYFRDQGLHVLLLIDSITRFAEAQREVAVSAGEFPSLRSFPASTMSQVTKFVERAGPGPHGAGDITAIFSVLVAASDMNEPVADLLRGVLDGHIILERKLADQGLFPAVDVLQSVSRCLPNAATAEEVGLISNARSLIARYSAAAVLVQSGLYTPGADAELDQAIDFRKMFLDFSLGRSENGISASFDRLRFSLTRCGALRE